MLCCTVLSDSITYLRWQLRQVRKARPLPNGTAGIVASSLPPNSSAYDNLLHSLVNSLPNVQIRWLSVHSLRSPSLPSAHLPQLTHVRLPSLASAGPMTIPLPPCPRVQPNQVCVDNSLPMNRVVSRSNHASHHSPHPRHWTVSLLFLRQGCPRPPSYTPKSAPWLT